RPGRRLDRLSPRELDVLALMAEGLGNTAIAERLVVTEGAVHKHIRNIFAKLGLAPSDRTDRRVAAVLQYLERGAP
ncbi:response regulator transcription factor, partial [Streptosporangium algeriense]